MESIKLQKGQTLAKKSEKVNYWYLIQKGAVVKKFEFSQIRLEKNTIIGISEKDTYLCDYEACEDDTVLAAFYCQNADELKNMLIGQEKIRNIFLRAAIQQRHQMLILYSELHGKTRQFHKFVESVYNDYRTLCNKYKIDVRPFTRMESFNRLEIRHRAEQWELNNSISIVKDYLSEYLKLMEKDDGLTVGVIMEAGAQMHRFALGIGEMEAYLHHNRDLLISDTRKDIFALLFDLSIKTYAKKHDIEAITKDIHSVAQFAEKLGVYNMRIVNRRYDEFKQYDYESVFSQDKEIPGITGSIRKEIDIMKEDCFGHILKYAGYDDVRIDEISLLMEQYRDLPDKLSTDKDIRKLRKEISDIFYDTYYKVFMSAMADETTLTPVLEMFLNFGFIDTSFVGETWAKELYGLSAHMDVCASAHIFTIFEWLKLVYKGEREPSKNEFDMDYRAYLAEQVKNGKLTKEELKKDLCDKNKMVKYEIENMFATVNRLTYGRISTFCPLLYKDDLITSVDKMLVTEEKLKAAMNKVRKIDFSIFYREVIFSDIPKGFNNEHIMKEILPDVILMPNAGNRTIMWQEASGARSNTPGRFMFPIFTMSDIDEMMPEVLGAFRWEICRKEQGMRWNDIRDKSLTAEYCAYIQFYRKNHELSADAKEKIKIGLARAKNSTKEMFVRDYINWIGFESRGSFRLNKAAREILARYCPFARAIRNELKENPLYQNSIARFEADAKKKLQKYQALYMKYEKADGEKLDELKECVLYYEM